MDDRLRRFVQVVRHGCEQDALTAIGVADSVQARSAVHRDAGRDEHNADGKGDRCEDRTVKIVAIEKLACGDRMDADCR